MLYRLSPPQTRPWFVHTRFIWAYSAQYEWSIRARSCILASIQQLSSWRCPWMHCLRMFWSRTRHDKHGGRKFTAVTLPLDYMQLFSFSLSQPGCLWPQNLRLWYSDEVESARTLGVYLVSWYIVLMSLGRTIDHTQQWRGLVLFVPGIIQGFYANAQRLDNPILRPSNNGRDSSWSELVFWWCHDTILRSTSTTCIPDTYDIVPVYEREGPDYRKLHKITHPRWYIWELENIITGCGILWGVWYLV